MEIIMLEILGSDISQQLLKRLKDFYRLHALTDYNHSFKKLQRHFKLPSLPNGSQSYLMDLSLLDFRLHCRSKLRHVFAGCPEHVLSVSSLTFL